MARDMEFFRKTTAGRPLVMGRKTALGIGRLLPGRLSLVLSRKPFLELGGVRLGRPGQPGWGHNPRSPVPKTAGFVLQGWDELLEFLPQVWAPVRAAYAPPAYVIGGAQILEESVQRGRLKELFFTLVDASLVDASLTSSQDGEPVYLTGNLRAWIQHKLQTEKPLVEIEKDQNNQYPARIYHFCGIPALCKKEISYEMVSIPPE